MNKTELIKKMANLGYWLFWAYIGYLVVSDIVLFVVNRANDELATEFGSKFLMYGMLWVVYSFLRVIWILLEGNKNEHL